MANEMIPVTTLAWQPSSVLAATFIATIALFSVVWALHVKKEDAGIVDFFWGVGFALVAWLSVALTGATTPVGLLFALLVTLWAARLTAHMVWRHRHMGGEDARYRAMRTKGGPHWWWRSLFTLYWLQAAIQWVLALPVHAALLYGTADPMMPLVTLGVVLFLAGFGIEAVADRQLWSFKANPANAGRLMTAGLFSWSRHPNYFGETVLWWGLGLVAFAESGAWWALVGPALITVLLTRVSGVSLLDAHLRATKPGYAEWAARTPAFVPRPPRTGDLAARKA
ncbi:DUF1295 domain-containing protein [Chthonobacter rhizosphaerae]|uniref:DUF1295 domain-containing protein n=1 Tax=Chthonobacter rhizosphaerae TaxID=2735553 RepID=UPI0015EF291C|nr:DUF1295 domain-containing protein [Chthonobacter rhizosphaerae]